MKRALGRVDTILKIDESTPYVGDFEIDGNKITKTSDFNKFYSQIVINEPIPKTGTFSFKIKILDCHNEHSSRSTHCAIFVGVIPPKFKNYRTSHFSR